MEEWKEYRLGDVCSQLSDGLHKAPKFKLGGDYIFVNAKNISNGFIVDNDLTKKSTHEEYLKYSSPLDDTSILYSIDGTIGNVALYRGEKVILGKGACYLNPMPNILDRFFLYYELLSPRFKAYIDKMSTGSTIKHISLKTMRNYSFVAPPLQQQRQIACILSSIDNKITCNRQINDNFAFSFLLLTCFVLWLLKLRNDNLEQQAQALFKSWLSHCSKMVTIGDLSLNITDYTKCEREEVVLINSSDVTEGHFEHHILSENKNLKGHFKKRFQKGDILYSQVRPRNRHWAFCTFDSDNYLASTQLMVIRNRPNVIPSILLYQYIIDDNVWLEFTLKTETRSGTFPQGNYEDLSSIRVPFGADTQSISASLERIYNLIYYNEDESRHLAQLRDTLLPRLMSGELKVNEIERTVG